jgi:phospholipase/carboxylesterase
MSESAAFGIVFLHGSGDTGKGLHQWIQNCNPDFLAKLNGLKFKYRFPSAKPIPYTLSYHYPSTVWHDRVALTLDAPEDTEGVLRSVAFLDAEIEQLILEGVPVEKIFIFGMSMGGHMALQ